MGVVLYYLIASGATFVIYAMDKSAARRGGRRVPEQLLHCLALLGGWPGAIAAQRWLRHKTRKRSFQFAFWLTVVANCAVLAWILWLAWSFTW